MAVEVTPLGFKKPDLNEPVKLGDNIISDNAQKAEDVLAATLADLLATKNRLGVAEARIDAGTGGGPGLSEDPDNTGTYFMAPDSPFTEDPENPGLYTF